MKKLLQQLLISFFLFWSSISFADQPYSLIQINCYEKSGYFELRNIRTHNLNMWDISEDENLINLRNSESVTKECVLPKRTFVKEQITVMVTIHPYCRNNELKCLETEAEFDIWYIDEKGKNQLIDKGKFAIGEDEPASRKRISKIEFIPASKYFVIYFEENTSPVGITKKFLKKEVAIFLPDGSFKPKYKLPLTQDNLRKMF